MFVGVDIYMYMMYTYVCMYYVRMSGCIRMYMCVYILYVYMCIFYAYVLYICI